MVGKGWNTGGFHDELNFVWDPRAMTRGTGEIFAVRGNLFVTAVIHATVAAACKYKSRSGFPGWAETRSNSVPAFVSSKKGRGTPLSLHRTCGKSPVGSGRKKPTDRPVTISMRRGATSHAHSTKGITDRRTKKRIYDGARE